MGWTASAGFALWITGLASSHAATDYAAASLATNQELVWVTRWLVYWTAALAGVGLLVGSGQVWLMRGNLKETKQAAELASRNAVLAARPWLIARPDGPFEGWTWEWEEPDVLLRMLVLKWVVTNHGRSPGWIVPGTTLAFEVVPRNPYPEDPPYKTEDADFVELALPPGESHSLKAVCTLTREDHRAVVEQKASLMLVGRIVYRDVFGETHRTCFAYEWLRPTMTIHALGGGQLYFASGPGGPKGWTEYT